MPVIPASGRWRLGDQKLKPSSPTRREEGKHNPLKLTSEQEWSTAILFSFCGEGNLSQGLIAI